MDLTGDIQRSRPAEEHFGIQLDGLLAWAGRQDGRGTTLTVNGEIASTAGCSLPQSIRIVVSAHDAQGRVLAVLAEHVDSDGFFEKQAFSASSYVTLPPVEIASLRVYPQGG